MNQTRNLLLIDRQYDSDIAKKKPIKKREIICIQEYLNVTILKRNICN